MTGSGCVPAGPPPAPSVQGAGALVAAAGAPPKLSSGGRLGTRSSPGRRKRLGPEPPCGRGQAEQGGRGAPRAQAQPAARAQAPGGHGPVTLSPADGSLRPGWLGAGHEAQSRNRAEPREEGAPASGAQGPALPQRPDDLREPCSHPRPYRDLECVEQHPERRKGSTRWTKARPPAHGLPPGSSLWPFGSSSQQLTSVRPAGTERTPPWGLFWLFCLCYKPNKSI